MALAGDNFEQIKSRVMAAYDKEEKVINKFRDFARSLKSGITLIRPYSGNAVSFVSSDGGDNRIFFNPSAIELVRVVDSRGNQCALDAIASNSEPQSLDERAREGNPLLIEPLRKLCKDLGLEVTKLSYLLGGLGQPGKSMGAIRTYRDIVEWAVLYELLFKEWGTDTILVREGLLRTKSFKREVFPRIDQSIRKACEEHKKRNVNVSMVGVAKQSTVLSKLSVALELEETFHKPFPCYVKVPREIEVDCYNYDRTWVDTLETAGPSDSDEHLYQSMGHLFLVKFGDEPLDPVWPVDIAEWDLPDVPRIMGQLLNDAQPGFPIPDFPLSVQKAHDHAKIGGIEMSVIQDIFFNGIMEKFTPREKEKVLRIRYLGENLVSRRYKNA